MMNVAAAACILFFVFVVASAIIGFGHADYIRSDESWYARLYGRFLASDAADAEREYRAAMSSFLGARMGSDEWHAGMERVNAALLVKIRL